MSIIIDIEDMQHRLFILKYIYNLKAKIEPKYSSESRFRINSINTMNVDGKKIFKSEVIPSFGNFIVSINYLNSDIEFELEIKPDKNVNNSFDSCFREYVTENQILSKEIFSIICKKENYDIVLQLIEDAINSPKKKNTSNLEIFYNKSTNRWCKLSEIESIQDLSKIFLPNNTMDEIKNYLDEFIALKNEYRKFGIAHKFTMLLEGKPGMGKTTISRAIAHHYNRRLYILNLANKEMNESDLIELFNNIEKDSVLVLEDIDSFFHGRKSGSECGTTISFSTLINLLDGSLSSGNGLITFITANNAENLDKALVRPGRIDKVIHFGDITKDQFDCAWKELISKDEQPDEELFKICRNHNLSMSALMHIFFFGKNKEGMKIKARESASERKFDSSNNMYL
jgi:SpoVK/Ycf46/Vps4 family AAA+-type ATPase